MNGWTHLPLTHQAQPAPTHTGHLATWKTNSIPAVLGKSPCPRISLCIMTTCKHLKEVKKIPKQTVMNPGERGQSFEAGDRAFRLTDSHHTCRGVAMETQSWGSPPWQVDNRNPLTLFQNLLLLFVYPQISFPLDTGLSLPTPPPHQQFHHHLPSTCEAGSASRGNGMPLFAFLPN